MRKALFLSAFLFLSQSYFKPVFALDCAHISYTAEKLICSDEDLKRKNEDLTLSFYKIILGYRNKDIRDALLASQQRWIDARIDQFERMGDLNPAQEEEAKIAILKQTENRIQSLMNFNSLFSTGNLIANIKRQQAFAAQFSGGPYRTYRTHCSFEPTADKNWAYRCSGIASYQHHTRVCSYEIQPSDTVFSPTRGVSVIVKDTPQTIATCGQNAANVQCNADTQTPKSGSLWNLHPHAGWLKAMLKKADMDDLMSLKFDPDLFDQYANGLNDQNWLSACLQDPSYPASSVSTLIR